MPRQRGCKDLSPIQRLKIIAFLELFLKADGSLERCAQTNAMRKYSVSRCTVRSVWKNRDSDGATSGRPGPRPRYTPQQFMRIIESAPPDERTTVRATAAATMIPPSTIQRYIKKHKLLRRRSSRVKPTLTNAHIHKRLQFVLSFVHRPIGLRTYMFDPMYDVVHLDEKWFYLYKEKKTYILTRRERAPHRTSPNKRFITKIMFLAAVARPRYDYEGRRGFDGKLGIWPIVEPRIAQRTTKHQTKGDEIMHPVNVDKNVYAKLLTEKVLPAIQARWPDRKTGTIYLQQDNATPHANAEGAIRDSPMAQYGWDVQIRRQPAKSPDLNILDLGYFHAIQSIQYRKRAYTVLELMKAVSDSFRELEVATLEKCFLTLQAVMEEVMKAKGTNNYDLPRVKKMHFPTGVLPASLPCSTFAVAAATAAEKRLAQELNPFVADSRIMTSSSSF